MLRLAVCVLVAFDVVTRAWLVVSVWVMLLLSVVVLPLSSSCLVELCKVIVVQVMRLSFAANLVFLMLILSPSMQGDSCKVIVV